MNFQQTLSKYFPNTLSEADFVSRSYQALQEYGFEGANTIACVGVCRDEITHPLVDMIYDAWGRGFNFSSLAGMLFLGKTGFLAAQHHAPHEDGLARYAFFALPHIAIGDEGEIGVCYRPGQEGESSACGALMAFRQEMLDGCVDIDLDPDDIEQSLLKHRLFPKIKYGEVPDLILLTQMAHEAIGEDLERIISLTVDTSHSNYAVLTGIQIHGAEENYVQPDALYVMVGGQRYELKLS